MPLAVADLIDPDPGQAVEQIDLVLGLGDHALTDPADRAPRDAHQLGHRGLARVDCQPRHLVLKRAGESGVVARPRNRADHHAMIAARHPRV